MTELHPPGPEMLRSHSVETFREGAGSRPHVLAVDYQGERWVLKDFDGCDRWFAIAFGRLFSFREARALRLLNGVHGVPELVSRPTPRSILMQRLNAVPVLKCERKPDWESYFQALQRLVDAMHERGMAHCDLRSPHNMLIDSHDVPWVVDFAGAWLRGARWNLPSRWLFRQLAQVDHSAIRKMKRRVAPHLLDADDHAAETMRHPLERPARAIGQGVRRVARAVFTRG